MKKTFFLTLIELIGFLFLIFLFTSLSGPTFLQEAVASEPPPQFTWMVPSSGAWYFKCPHGVAVDGSGNIYVADAGNIQKFSPDGTFLSKWGSWNTGDVRLESPFRIAADGSGNVYVADTE